MLIKLPFWKWGIILLLLSMLFACSQQSEPIDSEYLQSETYLNFSERWKQERSAQIDEQINSREFIQKFIECESPQQLSLPLKIEQNFVQIHERACELVNTRIRAALEVFSIGELPYSDILIQWLIIRKKSVYEDNRLLAVTKNDSGLVDFQKVGEFKKNLSQDISTDIKVSQKDEFIYISSIIDRKIIYPIEQHEKVEIDYRINNKGQINQF